MEAEGSDVHHNEVIDQPIEEFDEILKSLVSSEEFDDILKSLVSSEEFDEILKRLVSHSPFCSIINYEI